jgi:hypothetical protein
MAFSLPQSLTVDANDFSYLLLSIDDEFVLSLLKEMGKLLMGN